MPEGKSGDGDRPPRGNGGVPDNLRTLPEGTDRLITRARRSHQNGQRAHPPAPGDPDTTALAINLSQDIERSRKRPENDNSQTAAPAGPAHRGHSRVTLAGTTHTAPDADGAPPGADRAKALAQLRREPAAPARADCPDDQHRRRRALVALGGALTLLVLGLQPIGPAGPSTQQVAGIQAQGLASGHDLLPSALWPVLQRPAAATKSASRRSSARHASHRRFPARRATGPGRAATIADTTPSSSASPSPPPPTTTSSDTGASVPSTSSRSPSSTSSVSGQQTPAPQPHTTASSNSGSGSSTPSKAALKSLVTGAGTCSCQ